LVWFAVGLLLVGLASPSGPAAATERLVAFEGATLIDGTGAAPVAGAGLVVRGERILTVGARREVVIPEHAECIDVRGRWIVPGLIDAHVHFFQSSGLYTRPDIIDLRTIRTYADEIARIRRQLPATLTR
jgi:imidazolonepropionase-like amidohydrolase